MQGRTLTILGAIVTLIFGGAVLVACALIFFFTRGPGAPAPQPTSVAADATEAATELPTADPSEPVIRTRPPTTQPTFAPTPTFLPLPGNTTGTNPENVQVSGNDSFVDDGFVESPQQSVVNYYRDITRGNYDATWSQLTDDFKQKFNCCAPEYNYSGYVDWWDTVQRVDFGDIQLESESGNSAVVMAELIYTMADGGTFRDSDPFIELSYDRTQGRWLFEDKRANP